MATDIDYPEELEGLPFLRLPLRAGYGYAPGALTVVTPSELGARERVVFSSAPTRFNGIGLLFSSAQLAYFEGWYNYTLEKVLYFNIRLLASGTFESREVRIVGGIGEPQLVGANYWQVSVVLESRTSTVMSRAAYDALNS